MNKNDYYISQDYNTLAGCYNSESPKEMLWMQNVINDLKKDPSIDYRIVETKDGMVVERRGMILNGKGS
jgi:hypothetical protein